MFRLDLIHEFVKSFCGLFERKIAAFRTLSAYEMNKRVLEKPTNIIVKTPDLNFRASR